MRVSPVPNENPLPYHCADCREYFSVCTNTIMHRSKMPLQKWAIAIYLLSTNPKGIFSTRLAEYLGVTQKTAWAIGYKIREGWVHGKEHMGGPVEVDETFVGGKERNKHADKNEPRSRPRRQGHGCRHEGI